MPGIDRGRLERCLAAEQERFTAAHPRSQALFTRAQASLLAGVPMPWMVRWAGAFPVFVREGQGAHFTDVDGNDYLDLCLGDTGAMTGHTPPAAVAAIVAQVRRGITFMLPGEDAIWVAEELARRFGIPFWQFALSATDANRFAIRLAWHVTAALNRGILLTPFHNMALIAPDVTEADVDRHTAVFRESVAALLG